MLDRLDCRRTKTSRLFVPKKSKLHSAATEQVPRLKRVTKTKPASRNPDPSGRTIIAGTSELGLVPIHDGKNVVRVLSDDEERVPGAKPLEREVFGERFTILRRELFPV
jgi:hypothetical protein